MPHNAASRERDLGVAVVGAGYWGPNLLRNFIASPQWEVRWFCDLDEERARSVLGRYSTVDVTPEFGEVLADDRVDAVALATPPGTHAPLAMAALEAGKHVLVEKPLAVSYGEAEKVVQRAEESELTLMCDHTYCYTPSVQRIRDLVHGGELGNVLFFDSVRINLGLVQTDVDVMWDLAPHDLSILDYILPDDMRPVAVSAIGSDPLGTGVSCVGYLTLHLPGGALAHVHVNWLSPTKVRTTIIGGSARTLVWDDLDPSRRLTLYDRGVDLLRRDEVGLEDRSRVQVAYRSGDLTSPALEEREALRTMVDEFATAITEHRPPRTDGRSGLRVLDTLEAASRSLDFHGAVVPLRSSR
jgi:predicted dehydrogenase